LAGLLPQQAAAPAEYHQVAVHPVDEARLKAQVAQEEEDKKSVIIGN